MEAAGEETAEVMKTFEDTLSSATAEWVQAGLITAPQREAILHRHPRTPRGGRFVAVLATVGTLLFAIGVSLVIKANWEALGDWTKIEGLVVLLLGTYGIGWRLKMAGGAYPKTGDACLMIGALFFLCGIALVSQIFHLNARPATGVLVWWIGIAAVPWLARAKGAQFVSIVAGLVWLGMEMQTPGSLLAVTSAGDRYSGRTALAMESVFVLLGLAVWLFGLGLRGTRWAEFAGLHEKWGIVVAAGALYLLGFGRHQSNWYQGSFSGNWAQSWPALVVGFTLAGVATALAWRRSRNESVALAPWIAFALVPVFGVVWLGWLGDGGWLWSALAWLSLFALSVAIVRVGLETGREAWVNLGIALIALNILTRYFDLFGTMLEGGVFFIVTGILVIALGIYLERKRRTFVAAVRTEARA